MNACIIPCLEGKPLYKLGKGTHIISGTYIIAGNGAGTAGTITPNIEVDDDVTTISSYTFLSVTPIKYDGTTLTPSGSTCALLGNKLLFATNCSIGSRCSGYCGVTVSVTLA